MTLYEIHLRAQRQIRSGGVERPTLVKLAEIYKTKGWVAVSHSDMLKIEFRLFGRHFSESERLLEINKCNSRFIIGNFLKLNGFCL